MEHPEAAQPQPLDLDKLLVSQRLREPWFKSVIRNIRESLNPPKLPPLELTSRPVEGVGTSSFASIEQPWYKSLISNLRELLHPPKLPPLELTSRPDEGAEIGGLSKIEQSWFRSFFTNIRDFIHPPKLPPLEVTSKPVEVASIWGAYKGGEKRSGLISLVIHAGAIGLLFLVFQTPAVRKVVKNAEVIYLPNWRPKLPPAATQAGGGGGGGQHMKTPVSHGAPPKPALKQFVPPTLAIPKPKLPVAPTITAPAPPVVADNYADPLSKLTQLSAGPGSNGMGSGSGDGLGSGRGNGYGPGEGGGVGGGVYRIGGDVSQPVLLVKVEPEYSEEARKAKYSGTVLLSIIVDATGMPRDIKVIRPLGLGLDEKAVEAVSKWRFKPAMKNGHPVAVQANVEVNFRLL
jgi:protein TonB